MADDEPLHRFERLLGYLESDPHNAVLALECAEAALAADRPNKARALLDDLGAAGQLDEGGENLAGIAAMRAGDPVAAQARFERLLETRPDDPALRFNLAWSRALAGDAPGARATLDQATIDSLPQAAMLDLQLHHQLGEFEGAKERLDA